MDQMPAIIQESMGLMQAAPEILDGALTNADRLVTTPLAECTLFHPTA